MLSRLSRPHLLILGIIAIIFAVSANIAWLNPDPDYVIKTNATFPVLWQYNGDAVVEFMSAAYFPQYYRIDKTRINRPGYPITANLLGKAWGLVTYPFYKLSPLMKGLVGYLSLKLIVYLMGAFALYDIVQRYLSKEVALGSVALAFLHPFAVLFSTTFHTSELQFITPFILIWLWLNLANSYSHKKNILFSLLTGFLMLAKQNYAVYFSILIFSFIFARKYKASILSFAVHLLPLLFWFIALKFLQIPYYNHESANGLGVWLYQDFIFRNPLAILQTIITSLNEWLVALIKHFGIFVPLALFAASQTEIREKLNGKTRIFIAIFIVLSWLQTFAANRYNSYMTADLSILIIPLSAYLIYLVFRKYQQERLIPIMLAFYFIVGLITMIQFPWIHPYNQNGINDLAKIKTLEQP
jgi:hypothetical protein